MIILDFCNIIAKRFSFVSSNSALTMKALREIGTDTLAHLTGRRMQIVRG
jgi:hypothetical protein